MTTTWPVHGRDRRPDRDDRLRLDRQGHAAADRAPFRIRQERASSSSTRTTRTASSSTSAASASSRRRVTRENYRELLTPLLTAGGGQGFCVNLSVDTSSLDIMRLCRELGVLYIDTVVEPWPGFYFDTSDGPGGAHQLRAARDRAAPRSARTPAARPPSPAAAPIPAWCRGSSSRRCSTSPRDLGHRGRRADDRAGWARLMREPRRQGHPHRRARHPARQAPKPMHVFVNTWSVEGFVSEGMQPAELGWGTHETWMPENGRHARPADRRRSICCSPAPTPACARWCPTPGPQYGFLVTHNESISIADYFTVREGGKVGVPADLPLRLPPVQRRGAVAARDVRPRRQGRRTSTTSSTRTRSSTASTSSACCSTATAKNAYWYGSQLSIEETRRIAPYQNATGLQVTSAVLAGMVWALENPKAGIVEADEMDYRRCLEVQRPYLGPVDGLLHRLDAARRPPGLLPRGHRHERPLAVPQRPGAVRRASGGAHPVVAV